MSQVVKTDGLFENKWGIKYKISYEEFKRIKAEHKLVLKHLKRALRWWRFERKLEKNRLGKPGCPRSDVINIIDQSALMYWRSFYNRVLNNYKYRKAPVKSVLLPPKPHEELPNNYKQVIDRINLVETSK